VLRRTLLILALAAAPAFAQPVQTTPPAPAPPDLGRIIRVDLETGAGKLVIELYPDKAPITVANFLHYVDTHRYVGTHFFRAARAPGAPTVGLVQAGGFTDASKLYKPIAHEPTSQTGLHHGDGTVSMAREKPGSAQADFFIAVGDAPYLDAGNPAGPADGLGYAAFGRVVEGMDVVRAILAMPTDGKPRNPSMQGQILTNPVPILSTKREG
jgi:peptidyl-prolyl cis-trans isomerase A (cyclophilin A)